MSNDFQPPAGGSRRRRNAHPRSRSLKLRLSDDEHDLIAQAASAEGRASAAFAADATLAAARGDVHKGTGPLREALIELMRMSGRLNRIGTNLNQAVRGLNTTGQAPGDLARIAESCDRAADRADAAVEAVRSRLP